MVTDPATTPASVRGQIAFGASVAATYGLLLVFHVVFGMFFALSLVCLTRGVITWVLRQIRSPATVPADIAAQPLPVLEAMDRSVFVEMGQSK
jgi:enediyne biosynthesis protein E5